MSAEPGRGDASTLAALIFDEPEVTAAILEEVNLTASLITLDGTLAEQARQLCLAVLIPA